MINNPYSSLIILAGGNSIPIKDINTFNLNSYFTFGLNHVCRYYEPTALLWEDVEFYENNKKYIDSKNSIKITKMTNNGHNPIDIIKTKTTEHIYKAKGRTTRVIEHFFVGIFALTLGIDLGFKTIYLLGYDCCEINNNTHFHDYNKQPKNHNLHTYTLALKYFNKFFKVLPKNTMIYNVSPNSAINVFPKLTYVAFLHKLKEAKKINQQEARLWLKGNLK